MNRPFWSMIILTVLFFGLFAFLVYEHEETHKAIFRNFGVNSKISWGLFASYTTAENDTLEDNALNTLNSLQTMNEVVFYQYQAMLLFMFVFSIAILVIIVEFGRKL